MIDKIKDFAKDTAADFGMVWDFRPNVLICCVILGIVLFWI